MDEDMIRDSEQILDEIRELRLLVESIEVSMTNRYVLRDDLITDTYTGETR